MKINPAEQNPDGKTAKKSDGKNGLGISRGVYALGNSLKDALIWGTALSVALIGVIAVGREKSTKIAWVADKIGKIHEGSKGMTSRLFEGLEKKLGMKIKVTGPEVAAAFGIGWLFGHVVQIPSGVQGWNKAQKAIDAHDTLLEEKTRLVDANAELIEQNQRYRAALEKPAATFAERSEQKPVETAINGR